MENGVLNRYMGILLDDIDSIENFKLRINEIIEHIEKYKNTYDKTKGIIFEYRCICCKNTGKTKFYTGNIINENYFHYKTNKK